MTHDTNWKVFDALRAAFLEVPNIEKRWGMSASEAAEIAYKNDDELYSHVLEEYAAISMQNIYGESYERLGEKSLFTFNDISEERLIEAYKHSPNAARSRVKTDLSKETSITLATGEKIPINQHTAKNN